MRSYISVAGAYKVGCFGEGTRKCMDHLDYRAETVNQFAIFVTIFFERRFSF